MDYPNRPLGKQCAGSGRAFRPGDVCISAIVPRDGKMVRLDFCEDAWEKPDDVVGFWRVEIPESTLEHKKLLGTEALLDMFVDLSESPNPAQEKFRYVLALLLIRKRRLRTDGIRADEEHEWLQVSGSKSEGPWEVRDFQLSEEEINAMQMHINDQLMTDA